MDEVRQMIGQILDGFCENRADADVLPAVELLKACYERLPAGSQTDFFKILAERLQSEPISFSGSRGVNRSSHVLVIRSWAAFGPADDLPKLLFSLLRPDTREALESWALMIGAELLISLSSHSTRFSEDALATIKGQCALITYDQATELADSSFPPALVEFAQRLENLVKDIEFKRNVVQNLRPQLNPTSPAAPRRDATVGRASQVFDHQLFTLKLSEVSDQMQKKGMASDARAGAASRKTGGSMLLSMADGQLALLSEWLEGVDRICREVWQIQGEAVTPEFVRDILVPEAMTLIATREGTVKSNITSTTLRMGAAEDPYRAQHHLAMEIKRLQGEVSRKYDIEARTLEHNKVPRLYRVPAPVRPVSSALTVTRAPAPPKEVGGLGLAPYRPKPTQIPSGLPAYFPSELKARTALILAEAVRKFEDQTQTLDLCKYVISEMTPLFCEAVESGTMKPSMALEDGLGGMADLLRSLLVHNDDGPSSGLGLSDKAYRLGQEARKSEEWLRLARAIADAEGKQVRLRAESTKLATTTNTRIGYNIDRLRKECGWSYDALVEKTGIDKKAILSHVHGKSKPNPRTLKEYAQAFTKELNRSITANNLEE